MSGWTWTTPSTFASPTRAPSRNGGPIFKKVSPESTDQVTVYEPEDWDNRIRRYYDEHPSGLYGVIQPISG